MPETRRHGNTVQFSGSLSDSCGEYICNKGSSTIVYRTDCHSLQITIRRPVEEEKNGESRFDRFPVYNCSDLGVLLGRESLANHG